MQCFMLFMWKLSSVLYELKRCVQCTVSARAPVYFLTCWAKWMCKANSYRHRCVSVPALSFLLCHIFNAQRGFRRSFRRGSLSQSAILQMRCRATVGVASGERPRDMIGAITCWIFFFFLLYILSLTERVDTAHSNRERTGLSHHSDAFELLSFCWLPDERI